MAKPRRQTSGVSGESTEVRADRRWKYALVQHPMWLLIAEDSVCAERTPPWGCPTIEEYAQRLLASLDTVEKFPGIHINFDFSGVELEDAARRQPDIAARLRRLVSEGRISFVNGTYSQPHLHILSLESTIRQFEYGLKVIEDVTGYRVTCYASQEPGFSQMLPQILCAFGYESATTPGFPFGLRIVEGLLQHWSGQWGWVHGDDVVEWVGKDLSSIPVWLRSVGCPDERAVADDIQRGLLHPTRLRVDLPDMVEVEEAWVNSVLQYSDMVKLDQELAELASQHETRPRVTFEANYAYIEGVDAEELSRANTHAEISLLRLERLFAFLPGELPDFQFEEAWRTLLAAQHHDAYWTGAPELRAKSIERLRNLQARADSAAMSLARDLGRKLPPAPQDAQVVLLVSPGHEPCCRTIEFDLPAEDLVPAEESPVVHFQKRRTENGSVRAAVVCPDIGVGHTALVLRPGTGGFARRVVFAKSAQLENDQIKLRMLPDGSISLLKCENRCFLAGDANRWYYVDNGRKVVPEPVDGERFVERGPVYEAAQTSSALGSIGMKTRITLLRTENTIWVDTELVFPQPTEIGDYFDDTTKLQTTWHVGNDAVIRYVCGGCVETASRGKPFVAYPALDVATRYGSLTFRFDCATKCWLDEDGVLHCVVAWGHNGDHFHNRQGPLPGIMGPLNWLKPMDLRLKGKYAMRQMISLNARLISDAELVQIACAAPAEPFVVPVETGESEIPWCQTLYKGHTPNFITLSARRSGAGTLLRLLHAGSKPGAFRLREPERRRVEWARTLDGRRISLSSVPPWKIIEVLLVPK
ncbi:MAG: hypothetical protein QHI38_02060 [Armatimonadota bacterium]|nr:hypothetical protein [Armatimonadota bacterium]